MSVKRIPEKEAKDGETQKLKKRIRKLEKDNDRLKSELKTLEAAFKITSKYLKDNTDGMSVEKVIKGVKEGDSLKKIKDTNKIPCSKCNFDEVGSFSLPFGRLYLCPNCDNRWTVKE